MRVIEIPRATQYFIEMGFINDLTTDKRFYTEQLCELAKEAIQKQDIGCKSEKVQYFKKFGKSHDSIIYINHLDLGNNFTQEHLIDAILHHDEIEKIIEVMGETVGLFNIEAHLNFNGYLNEQFTDEFYTELVTRYGEIC